MRATPSFEASRLEIEVSDERLQQRPIGGVAQQLWGRSAAAATESAGRTKSDYFRYVDTRLRRVEAGSSETSRVKLTGPRRQLKDFLDSVGRVETIYPFIADDGEGGVFAEWKAGPQRIEASAEEDLTAHVVVSQGSNVVLYAEFDAQNPLSSDLLRKLRAILNLHTVVVNSLNPDWRSLFVG